MERRQEVRVPYYFINANGQLAAVYRPMIRQPYYDFFTADGEPNKLGDVLLNPRLPFYDFLGPSASQAANLQPRPFYDFLGPSATQADNLQQAAAQHNQLLSDQYMAGQQARGRGRGRNRGRGRGRGRTGG